MNNHTRRTDTIRILTAGLGIAMLLVMGCADGPELVPVSGRVTLDGEPLPNAHINTQPIGGMENPNPGGGSWGKTDQDGRYTLELVEEPGATGAVIGEHRVAITLDAYSADPTSDEIQPRTRPDWPRRFTDYSLTISVPEGGTESADIDLKLDE